jgi:uncharacterized paraquat-inducible protein A
MSGGVLSNLWLPVLFNLVIIGAAWLYYDLRHAWSRRPTVRSAVFRCTECQAVYADDSGVPRIACPRCGHHNDAVRK